MASIDVQELEYSLKLLQGVQNARFLALASFAFLIYDYCLTFEQEFKYFWTGKWSISRALFLLNRYFSPIVALLGLILLLAPNLSPKRAQFPVVLALFYRDRGYSCSNAIPATFVLDYLSIAVVQAIVVVRIWYMFSNRRIARLLVVATFISTFIATGVLLGTVYPDLRLTSPTIPGLHFPGCSAPPSDRMWRIFAPNLILHTVLYIATTWPALRMRRRGRHSPLMNRLVMDGGIFYVAVFVSAAFTTIGSLQHNRPSVMIPAIYANFLLCLSSVSVSRLMLSIRSLAASLSMDSDMLLSDAELSRVRWRKGAREGELVVEINAVEREDVQMGDAYGGMYGLEDMPVLHTSQVGVYEDARMPGADRLSRTNTKVGAKRPPRVTFDAGTPFDLAFKSGWASPQT